ncbi:MAG: DotI/IcmL/TraM family protein [Polaromonas sp.]|nr:DotI/IcmL/TraM family protein [Polaromonas sp.]
MSEKGTKPSAPQRPRTSGTLETIRLRNTWYRDMFRIQAPALLIVSIALVLSLALNVVLAMRKPVERYFTVDGAGRVIPIRGLSEPYVTPAFLTTWVSESVIRAHALDPQNYRTQVADLRGRFTTAGYDQFVASLQGSGTIDFMTKRLMIQSAALRASPVITEQGLDNATGTYFWRIQIPVIVDFRSATASVAPKQRVVEVLVVRRQTLDAPEGIGIAQFVSRDV